MWGAPVPSCPPCPGPHISSCWILHQLGTVWCFWGAKEELGDVCQAPSGVSLLQAHSVTRDPPGTHRGPWGHQHHLCISTGRRQRRRLLHWGRKQGFAGSGENSVGGVSVPPHHGRAEGQWGARVGQVCGSWAQPAASVLPLRRVGKGTSWEPAGRRFRGQGRRQQTWPPRNVRTDSSGKTATSHQLCPLGSGMGIPAGQREAEGFPQCTCPISGLQCPALGGVFLPGFLLCAPPTWLLSGGPVLGGNTGRLPSTHGGVPAALLARGPHCDAGRLLPRGCPVPLGAGRTAAELVRRRCGISPNCLHFDVRNLLPEGYSLPAANLCLASGC